MGLPQAQEPQSQQPQQQQPNGSLSSSAAKSISDLPPEAIQLATTLFDYARTGATSQLQQYLSAGIPANLTNHKGDTLLMLAAYHGHLSLVQMLLEKGADPNVVNERGQSIVAGAVFKGEDAVVNALVEAQADLDLGQPSAREAGVMFRRVEALRIMGMEEEAGRVEGERPS